VPNSSYRHAGRAAAPRKNCGCCRRRLALLPPPPTVRRPGGPQYSRRPRQTPRTRRSVVKRLHGRPRIRGRCRRFVSPISRALRSFSHLSRMFILLFINHFHTHEYRYLVTPHSTSRSTRTGAQTSVFKTSRLTPPFISGIVMYRQTETFGLGGMINYYGAARCNV